MLGCKVEMNEMSSHWSKLIDRLDKFGFGLLLTNLVQIRELVMLGVAIAALAWLPALFDDAAQGAQQAVGLAVLLVFCSGVSLYMRWKDSVCAEITAAVLPHQSELSIRRQQLCRKGRYGEPDDKAWHKEVERFLEVVVSPTVRLGSESRKGWAREIVNAVASAALSKAAFNVTMSPVEYEGFVAQVLREFGWDASMTVASGDQGVDVLARKGLFRLVIQCKLYSGTVGNAAVQEAIAAREWESATHAAVVSNAGFSRSAQDLAHKSGVFLWHHDQLAAAERECASRSTSGMAAR